MIKNTNYLEIMTSIKNNELVYNRQAIFYQNFEELFRACLQQKSNGYMGGMAQFFSGKRQLDI